MKSKIEEIDKEIRTIISSAGLTGKQYEWQNLRENLLSRRQNELDDRVRDMENRLADKLLDDQEEIERQTLEIGKSGGGNIEMDELRSYEEKNRMLRAAFYAAITFFVLAEAIVNGVGLEGMGFSPLVAFIGAGFLGGFIFWSAHLLGSYIKQSKFYYPEDKKKQLAFTTLFVIIATGILMFFTYTRHDYLVQLETQSQPVVVFDEPDLSDGISGADEGSASTFSAYDYLFIFIKRRHLFPWRICRVAH